MAFFVKITPPLTFSSSEPLVENVVNVVSVVSQNRILPKNRYLFLPVRSPGFRPLESLVSPSSKSRVRPPIPLSSSQSPLPSSPIPVPVLSHPPKVPVSSSQSPLPSSSSSHPKTAERHEAVPPFLMVGSKMEHCLFLSVYEGLPNNPLNVHTKFYLIIFSLY